MNIAQTERICKKCGDRYDVYGFLPVDGEWVCFDCAETKEVV